MSLMLFVVMAVVVFSSFLFYAEGPQSVSSILESFYWAIITMTTVGYGDMAPITPLGRLVGAMCAVFGVVVMVCLPSPVFISSFNEIYLQYVKTLKKSEQVAAEEARNRTNTNWKNRLKPSNILLISKFCGAREAKT